MEQAGPLVHTKTCINTGANGLFATGSVLYISYNKNKTTIRWLVDGSKSGCCNSINCKIKEKNKLINLKGLVYSTYSTTSDTLVLLIQQHCQSFFNSH